MTALSVSANYPNGVPKAFIKQVQSVLAMLHACAQIDLHSGSPTPSYFALVTFKDGSATIDARAITRSRVTGRPEDQDPLTPEGLDPEEANQVMIDAATSLDAQSDTLVLRVSSDAWIPADGLTEEGAAFVKRMSPAQQHASSGSLGLWVAEFISPGAQWYARSAHTVNGSLIDPADLVTAVVAQIIDRSTP